MTADTTDRNTYRLSSRNRGIIFILLIATFVVILNETIMNVALPKLMVDLHLGAGTVQWLATAFMLTMAVIIPTTGFLIQRLSTRTVFLAALGLFSLGTLIAGLAPGFPVLLVGRVVQASGTAIMLPLLITTVLALVPAERRGAVMGTISIVISVAPAIGPTLSGLILEVLPWRFLFLCVLPIALLVLAYGARQLVNVGETNKSTLDIPSVVLSALGFGGLVYGFSSAGDGGWGSPKVLATLAIGGLSLLVFVLRQLALGRKDAPLLDLRAFRYPMFTLSVVVIMIAMMALFGGAIMLPIYLQNLRGLGSLGTGLLLLPGGLLMGLAAPTVGKLFDRHGPVALSSSGAALLTLSLWRFSALSAETPVWMLLALHLMFSLGLALLFTPILATGLNPLPSRLYSHGSAIMSTLQMVSGAVGTALLVTVMTTRAVSLRGAVSPELAQISGLQLAFAVATGIAVFAFLLTFFLRRVLPGESDSEGQIGGDAELQPVSSSH
ncbi:MAG: DHA2 family efflux MFS transporter permease subunit [Thermaceae bacterium]|nr:DHA2 family efflux MFS transporter permease subunit [Thermaceae bacterium]